MIVAPGYSVTAFFSSANALSRDFGPAPPAAVAAQLSPSASTAPSTPSATARHRSSRSALNCFFSGLSNAEVEDGLTGIKDDVEFLFSLNNPIVGYRSEPRVGGDAKRQKVRIRDLRKTLQESGWKSVGRAVNVE